MVTRILEVSLLDDKQEFSISSLVWADPAAWGILLVDLAKTLAEGYSREYKMDANDAFARIFEGVKVELTSSGAND